MAGYHIRDILIDSLSALLKIKRALDGPTRDSPAGWPLAHSLPLRGVLHPVVLSMCAGRLLGVACSGCRWKSRDTA